MIFASTRVLQEPTQAQETTEPGIWKIGMRDPLKDVRRQVPSGETKLVTNIDVSGRINVGFFSVGHGWKNQRVKEAPSWIQHQRAITAPRPLDGELVSLSQTSETRGSSLLFYGHKPMDGLTVLNTSSFVKTSQPRPRSSVKSIEEFSVYLSEGNSTVSLKHSQNSQPSLKYPEKLKRLAPTELLPRRIIMQQNVAHLHHHQEEGGDGPHILQNLLSLNLEASWSHLNHLLSHKLKINPSIRRQDILVSVGQHCISEAEFESMLFESNWNCENHMIELMRTYACDAGIDAALVVSDMWQCIKRPDFSAARWPAAMSLVKSSLSRRLKSLKARFFKSDDEARENSKNVGMRAKHTENPARHIDLQVFQGHLQHCGFNVDPKYLCHLQMLYCCHEGQWKGYINYQQFLTDLTAAATEYLGAEEGWAEKCGARTTRGSTPSEDVSQKRSFTPQNLYDRDAASSSFDESGNKSKQINIWQRIATPDLPSRPGTSLSEQRSEVRFLDSASKEARFHDIQPSRDRMKTVINKIDFIFRSFQNADNRQNGTISVSFAESVMRSLTPNFRLKDLAWILERFSRGNIFRYQEFVDWLIPPKDNKDVPPKLSGQVPNKGIYRVTLRGGIVLPVADEGINSFQPAASRNKLRMPFKDSITPSEWAKIPIPPPKPPNLPLDNHLTPSIYLKDDL